MKDHVLHAVSANEELRSRCYQHWSPIPELAAATGIANTAKHVVLRRGPTTQAVIRYPARKLEFTIADDGNYLHKFRLDRTGTV